MGFTYNFSVVKGIQAKREYYIAMVPLGILTKLFRNEDEYILPEYRAQRCINEARIPEIKNYILENRNNYVFSALSASIDGDFEYVPSELDNNLGILKIDMNAVFLINDGQHRKAAIEASLNEDATLSNETIAIVFFKDEGLKRSQQMFADLNKHAVKSTMSLSTLYDSRDDLANAVKQVVAEIPFLNKYVDREKDTLGKNSLKLFTLANFLRANKRIVKDDNIDEAHIKFLKRYWQAIFTYIDEWEMLEKKQIYKCDLREEYILTLSVTLNAFGRLGRYFNENFNNLDSLKKLKSIDWMRTNPEWISRAVSKQGKIINNEDSIIKICNLIKTKIGIKLTKEEESKEREIKD
ncbi:MAG: DNA sulfur modification protein DndB [Lachnospiraceae bacterium]|nr:DNA sulfur modification protein DndB [Lachnospiraceae bacterium]